MQKPFGAQPVQWPKQSVQEARAPGRCQLVVLGRDPRREHLIDAPTIVHWDRFNHGHVAFWLWACLYLVTPFLVMGGWLANQRFAEPAGVDERRLGGAARWIVVLIGLLALVQGIVMFLSRSPG